MVVYHQFFNTEFEEYQHFFVKMEKPSYYSQYKGGSNLFGERPEGYVNSFKLELVYD